MAVFLQQNRKDYFLSVSNFRCKVSTFLFEVSVVVIPVVSVLETAVVAPFVQDANIIVAAAKIVNIAFIIII
jgi:hypothetical protein